LDLLYPKDVFLLWGTGRGEDCCLQRTHRTFTGLHINEYEALVEWYWQGRTEVLGGEPVSGLLCQSQIPHGLPRYRNQAFTDQKPTTWYMSPPLTSLLKTTGNYSHVFRETHTAEHTRLLT